MQQMLKSRRVIEDSQSGFIQVRNSCSYCVWQNEELIQKESVDR